MEGLLEQERTVLFAHGPLSHCTLCCHIVDVPWFSHVLVTANLCY